MSRNPEVALTLKARDEASRTVSRVMQDTERQTQRAEKAVIGLSRESQRMASAREQLGVRAERAIQREIQQTEAAYKRLANSGTLSAKEQARAYEAMRDKVAGLRREMAGVSQLQRGLAAGARGVAAGVAGVAAGAYVVGQPVKRTMEYDRRLAMMANTAFAERDVGGRRAGVRELDDAIKRAVREGGGTREGAAETLDNLLASGSMSQKSAVNLLPTLQKYATATGADPNELGNIAIRAMQTFKVKESELPLALDMAIKAGQEGGFELKDMSKWLPQQMAAAKQAGMSGMGGLAKLLAANQAAVITAGTKDEAGNNLVNLLAKINSQDTAKDASKISASTFQEKKKGEKGIDLAGTLAAAREKGVNSLDAFVGLVDKVVGHDKRYQDIQTKLKTAKGDDRKVLLESQGDILQGSAVGKLIQDRQALMALVGYMGNRDYVKSIEAKLPGAGGTGQANFDMIASTASYQTERAKNEKAIAEQQAFDGLSSTIGSVAGKLADYAQAYPGLSTALVAATTAVTALGAAAGAAAIPMMMMGGGPGVGGTMVGRALGGAGVLLRAGGGVALAGAAGYGVGTAINAGITGVLTATNGGKERTLGTWLYDLFNGDQDAKLLAPTPMTKRNAPSSAAPIPQLDMLQSAVNASTKLDLAAQKMQQATSTPIPVTVTVDVQNGNIVASVNAANAQTARETLMAWADTLLDASFRGVTFDCLRTQDSAQRDTASHEYPYLDGADVEDLGRKARHITMSAVFFGKDYENRLQTFIKELDKPGHGELIHPVFGSIKQAQLTDYQVGHDADNPDYCTVELTFVEATPGNPFFVQQLPAQKAEAVSQLAATSRANGIEAFAKALDGLKSIKGNLSRLNALRDMMTGTLGAIRSQVQGIIGTTLDLIDYPRAFASDVMSLVSGIADLRGFDVGVILSDWKSLVGQFDNVVALPGKVSAGSASTGGSSGSGGTGGGVVADAKPIPAKPEDIALVTALVQISAATTLAETAGQILAAEAEQPTLSPQEVEQIANDVRDTLQQVIEAHRDLFSVEDARPVTEALKDTALGVQEAAVAVIEALPPLVTRTVDAPGNLHLVAFRWYGDYTRAQELARLNPKLTNPNALQAGDTLYAYAR